VDTTTQILAWFIILVVFVINAIVRRRTPVPLRRLEALDMVPRLTGASIETNRALHLATGSAGIGDESTMAALVGTEFLYFLTREVAIGDASPLFTVSQTSALPLAVDTLRRAYHDENLSHRFKAFNVRWHPTGSRSLSYAAALMTMQGEDRLGGNVLVGRYGMELALILDAAYRYRLPTIASSTDLDGQAIAYALADAALIGEEVFAAPAYAGDVRKLSKRVIVFDLVRWFLILMILALAVFSFLQGNGG
jgi:hypothetical protein